MDKPFHHHENTHGYGKYVLVWLALLTFTGITVAVAGINFGRLTVAAALIIASVKTYLVLTIFMHLKLEQKVFRIFVIVAIFFLSVSFVLLFSDYSFYVR